MCTSHFSVLFLKILIDIKIKHIHFLKNVRCYFFENCFFMNFLIVKFIIFLLDILNIIYNQIYLF